MAVLILDAKRGELIDLKLLSLCVSVAPYLLNGWIYPKAVFYLGGIIRMVLAMFVEIMFSCLNIICFFPR